MKKLIINLKMTQMSNQRKVKNKQSEFLLNFLGAEYFEQCLWFVQIIALKLNGSSFNLFEQHII
jgi:hypothetical protein